MYVCNLMIIRPSNFNFVISGFVLLKSVTRIFYCSQHYAARNGHAEVCSRLLAHGACVNAQTRSGRVTSLQRAAYGNHVACVKVLLRHKADVLLQDDDGKTALHKVGS